MELLRQASGVALLGLVVAIGPLAAGVWYAVSPTERRLALMRPLSLAAIFSGLGALVAGMSNALQWASRNVTPGKDFPAGPLAMGLAEAMIPLFVTCACLTVGWLCVTIGMRRGE